MAANMIQEHYVPVCKCHETPFPAMHSVKTTNWWAVAVSTAQFCPQKPSRNTAADARAGEAALQPDWTPPWPAAHQVSSIMTYSQGQTYLALQIYIQCRRTACSVHVARHGADRAHVHSNEAQSQGAPSASPRVPSVPSNCTLCYLQIKCQQQSSL